MRKEKLDLSQENQATSAQTTNDGLELDFEILQVRRVVAGNPNTPRQVLLRLAEDANVSIRRAVAENPRTPIEVLKKLVFDPDSEVRMAVAENKNSPAEILALLARDENVDVRYGVAESPHMPEAILVALAHDDNPYVRCRSLKTLQMLAPDLQARLKLLLSPPVEKLSDGI